MLKFTFKSSSSFLCTTLMMFTLFCLVHSSKAQNGYWNQVLEPATPKGLKKIAFVKEGTFFKLDFEALKAKLRQAPEEKNAKVSSYGMEMALPLPGGKLSRFAIASYELMDKPLDGQLPEMRNFYGQCLDDPATQVYLDFTMHGFHALVLTPTTSYYIDPVFLLNTEWYVCYESKNASSEFPTFLSCDMGKIDEGKTEQTTDTEKSAGPGEGHSVQVLRGMTRKSYRLAVSGSTEFTAATGGNATTAMSAINTILNRANAIYGRDMCIRLNLVSNSVFLMYSTNPDPYENSINSLLLDQINTNINFFIGSSRYDIGHLFTTLPGGLAQIGSVCGGSKGRGTSGTSNPFDPQLVGIFCHEVGHQLGAEHTFNGAMGFCNNDNRHQPSAVEPGSGSTIMSYAGTCGSHNVTNTRLEFFHALSLRQMSEYIESGNGRTCGTNTELTNTIPSINTTSPPNLTIPMGTPYTLNGIGSDADGDALSFSWEQDDAATSPDGIPLDSSRTTGPLSMSVAPLPNGTRSIPTPIEVLLPSQLLPGNKLPYANRDMVFTLTIRDNRAGGGAVVDAGYNFRVTKQAGPFRLITPFETDNIGAREPLLVTWDRANSHLPPVNCHTVRISLSVDGTASSFPYILSAATPNDGQELVYFPPGVRSSGYRAALKIEAVDNIFYSVRSGFNLRDYCYAGTTCNGTPNAAINRVRVNTLDQSSDCSPIGYSNYASNTTATTTLMSGQSYPITVNWATGVQLGVAAWIDYNNDGDFRDPGELLFSRAPGMSPAVQNVTILAGQVTQGYRRMRIRTRSNFTFGANDACSSPGPGETEDYLVNISGYCLGTSSCSQGGSFYDITRLQYRGMDVTSECSPTGYTDHSYIPPVDVQAGEAYPLIVSTTPGTSKSVGVWIDKNYDFDFDDHGEFVFQTPVQNTDQFYIPFMVPGQPMEFGVRRVRVRLLGNEQIQGNQACSLISLGETEDFEINITGYCFSGSICSDEGAGQHFINGFQLPQLSNTNSGCTVGGFRAYHENEFLGKIVLGTPTNGSMQISGGNLAGQSLWIDVNNDGYFDPEEQYASRVPSTSGTWNFSLNIPNSPGFAGMRRLRIRSAFNTTLGGADACTVVGFGETEDYMVMLTPVDLAVQNAGTILCRSNPIPLSFTSTGIFGSDNQVTAEISDATGSFASPVVVGSGSTSPIMVTIPSSFASGGMYRFRLRSSNPMVVSDPGSAFALTAPPAITSINPTTTWVGQQVTIEGTGLNTVQRVFFGSANTAPIFVAADGSSLRVLVPLAARSGPVRLTGPCEITGPEVSVRNCPFGFTNPEITQATGIGCQNGAFRVTVTGTTSGNPKVQLFKETAPGSSQLIGNVLLSGTLTAQFTGLAPGPYFAVVRDNTSCRDTLKFSVVGMPCGLSIQHPTSTLATGNDGTLSFGLTGVSCHGVDFTLKRPIEESWNPIAATPTSSAGGDWTYSSLPSGWYRVVATDPSQACADSVQVLVQSAASPVATPVIQPGGGSFSGPQSISITCATPLAQIYYTLNGNTPVPGTVFTFSYLSPFTISSSCVVKALAMRSGLTNSALATETFSISAPPRVALPTFSMEGGAYDAPILVSLSCATPGSTIYYTQNGNTPRVDVPNTFTLPYSGPIYVGQSQTIKALAVAAGMVNSQVVKAVYSITNPLVAAATPVITPGSGPFSGSVQVSISAATPGSLVYYTTSGNVPRVDILNSYTQLYSGPFSISNTTTVRAIALAPGFAESACAVSFLTRMGGARLAVSGGGEEGEAETGWDVFPNPTQGRFTIQPRNTETEYGIEVFSIQGKKVMEKTTGNKGSAVEIDLSSQPAGLYTLRIQERTRSEVRKIQKL